MNNSETNKEITIKWTSGINLILGLWLLISPWAIGYIAKESRLNEVIVGAVIFVLSWIRLVNRSRTGVPSWLNFLIGIWLIIAPFVMHYMTMGQKWNSIVVGIIVALLGIASGTAGASRHHPTATA